MNFEKTSQINRTKNNGKITKLFLLFLLIENGFMVRYD